MRVRTTRDTVKREMKWIGYWSAISLVGLVVIGAIYACGAAAIDPTKKVGFWVLLAMSLAVVFAGGTTGGFLGFLFGIPRLLNRFNGGTRTGGESVSATPGSNGQAAASARFDRLDSTKSRTVAGNSNLEEVSDWITKIIIGLTLVHFQDIIKFIQDLSRYFSKVASQENCGPVEFQESCGSAGLVFTSLLIASFFISFFAIYLLTRTRITTLLSDTEGVLEGQVSKEAVQASVDAPVVDLSPEALNDRTEPGAAKARKLKSDEELSSTPESESATAEELAARASAQARKGNFQAAMAIIDRAVAQAPDDPKLLLRSAEIALVQGNHQRAGRLFTEVRAKDKDSASDPNVLKQELFNALYIPPPDGFREALRVGTPMLTNAATKDDPWVMMWVAAAHGQECQYAKNNSQSANTIDTKASRDAALKLLKQIKVMAPSNANAASAFAFAQKLFDPVKYSGQAAENDFEVFKGDKDFDALFA